MTEACIHVADVHDRMPVIPRREDRADSLDGRPIMRRCCADLILS
jgi:putative SOS response-associated peptidase YedK